MAMNPISRTYAANSTGSQDAISVDWRDAPNGFSYQLVFNAGASGSVTLDTTLDNVNDVLNSITPVWTSSSAITGITSGTIGGPIQFIRLTVGSLSGGTLTLKILEGAPDAGGGTIGPGGGGGGSGTITPVIPAPNATATETQVPSNTAAVTLLAANTARYGATVYYDGAAILYLLEGSGTPSATNWTYKLGAASFYSYEAPAGFTGAIKGIWSAAVGSANVTERTA
jgi:hypothetical protein